MFEFARHHSFNAIPYFNQKEHGGLGHRRRPRAGISSAAPLAARSMKDKLFFFGGLQYHQPEDHAADHQSDRADAGSAARRFPADHVGGLPRRHGADAGAPFVDNQINPSLFSPFALKLLKFIPTADPAYDPDGCGRYPLAIPNDSVEQQIIGRVDYQMNANNRIFGRVLLHATTTTTPASTAEQSEPALRQRQRPGHQEPHAHVRRRPGPGDLAAGSSPRSACRWPTPRRFACRAMACRRSRCSA